MPFSMEEKEKEYSWYAIRTFYCKEDSVAQYLSSQGVEHFIPQRFQEEVTLDGERKRKLVPAVHNLLFIKQTLSEKEIKDIITRCPISVSVLRNRETKQYYKIPNSQMIEFRAICDPNYTAVLILKSNASPLRIVIVGVERMFVSFHSTFCVVSAPPRFTVITVPDSGDNSTLA